MMNRKGKLYLIPVPLAPHGEGISYSMPPHFISVIRQIQVFVVENKRSARRVLSASGHPDIRNAVFHKVADMQETGSGTALLSSIKEGKRCGDDV